MVSFLKPSAHMKIIVLGKSIGLHPYHDDHSSSHDHNALFLLANSLLSIKKAPYFPGKISTLFPVGKSISLADDEEGFESGCYVV